MCVCVHVCICLYFFFHQEDVEVNTCHCRAGKDQGITPWHAQGRSKAQPLTGAQHLRLHVHTELQGPHSQQSFLLSATLPVYLLHTWTKQRDLQHVAMTPSLRERQILLCSQISLVGTIPHPIQVEQCLSRSISPAWRTMVAIV